VSQIRVLGLFESSSPLDIEGDSKQGGSDLTMGNGATGGQRGHQLLTL
jgi:hypothetical protein